MAAAVSGIYFYVEDADATYEQALAAGATSIMQPMDMFYGDRHGGVKDPRGEQLVDRHPHRGRLPEELARRGKAAAQERKKG